MTGDAADCVSVPDSVLALPAVLHAASELSACATSETKSGIWLDSKQLPAAQPELSPLAIEDVVSSQVLQMLWRQCWVHWQWPDWTPCSKPGLWVL